MFLTTVIYKEENLEQNQTIIWRKKKKTSKVVHTCYPRTWEAEDGDQDPDTEKPAKLSHKAKWNLDH